jgi:carbamoyl-phosphate synthase large subunit
MGGQTALNCALELERQAVLEEFGVTMIGATADAIDKAEDRRRFDVAMKKIGLDTARSGIAHTMEEALAVAADVGFPCIIRPSFTMGAPVAVSHTTVKSSKRFASAASICRRPMSY